MNKYALTAALAGTLAFATLSAACGSSSGRNNFGDDPKKGAGSSGDLGGPNGPAEPGAILEIAPLDSSLSLDDKTPTPSLDYTATLVHADKTREDVSKEATFKVDQGAFATPFGTFAGAKFTADANGVGKAQIKAETRGLSATTSLTLRLKKILIGEGAPADAATKFGGADDPSRKPALVYPGDGVIAPPNMSEIELHFQPGGNNDLFELSITSDILDLRVYMGCKSGGTGCINRIDKAIWTTIAEGGRGQAPMVYKLRGTRAAGGAGVGTSATQTISFGEENITGGIYYWNANPGTTMRYEFGVSGQKAETYMNAAGAGAATCVGCHVLSRDGSKVAIGLDIPGPAVYKVYDTGTKAPLFTQGSQFGGGGANFFSFSPDNSKILASNGITIDMRDAATGAALAPGVATGAMPDWSPDGTKMVYAKPKTSPPCFGGLGCGATGVNEAAIESMTFDGTAWAKGPTLVTLAAGKNSYYPSFSPDGAFVILNQAAEPSKNGSYDAPDASLQYVAASGGSAIALAKAGSPNGDSWPKWAPLVQKWRTKKLMWFTFSSRRAYGLKMAAGTRAQIWMAGFDPEAAKAGKDASFTSFWLPFQDDASANHIGQWVTKVARKPCNTSGGDQCGSNEVCEGGVCKPILK